MSAKSERLLLEGQEWIQWNFQEEQEIFRFLLEVCGIHLPRLIELYT